MKIVLNTTPLIFLTRLEPKAIITYLETMSEDPSQGE
jgi:hypothetical protein